MNRISVKNVTASYGSVLFRDVSFSFGENDRVGVVGDNAVGKTTLLNLIMGIKEPSEGSILRPSKLRIGYIEQTTPPVLMDLTLREVVLTAIPPDERDYFGWRAEVVLEAFGAPDDMRERRLMHLSGGWQRLALIGRIWASDPDVLIMDEPTNHLDLEKIMMLERWLNSGLLSAPLLMVSHDRRFLDLCTNRTLFLRPNQSRTYDYPFSRARELLSEDDRAVSNRKEREIKEMQRLRKSAGTLRQLGVDNHSSAALRKSVQIAKRAEIIENALSVTPVGQRRDIKLTSRETHAKRILTIENVTIRRPDSVALFHIGRLDLNQGDRIILLGRNGTGKTQFVQFLRASFANLEGTQTAGITIATSVVMGYMDQNMTQLPEGESPREYVSSISGTGEHRATSLLVAAGFSIPEHTHRISDLTPGQKARLALLTLRLSKPSFFLMDEPTNHLDITGQEQLEAELSAHVTSAMIVSHDRVFVEKIGSRCMVVEGSVLVEINSPELFYEAIDEGITISQLSTRLQIL